MIENAPKEMSFPQLEETMRRGTRLCDRHSAHEVTLDTGVKMLECCLAIMPASMKVFEARTLPSVLGVWPEGDNNMKGCRTVRVPFTDEVGAFYKSTWRIDPGVFHTTTERVFIRLDIARFTQFSEEIQPRAIAELHEFVIPVLSQTLHNGSPPRRENLLHTGDGFVLAFEPHDEHRDPWPLDLARNIADALDLRNADRLPINFRIAVTRGPVYLTGDLDGKPNYVGEAISETDRLLSCIDPSQDDVICFSEKIYRHYREDIKSMKIVRLGARADKWGKLRKVYTLEYAD